VMAWSLFQYPMSQKSETGLGKMRK
jgi:hypothetical protein